jgi:hypothetical protein
MILNNSPFSSLPTGEGLGGAWLQKAPGRATRGDFQPIINLFVKEGTFKKLTVFIPWQKLISYIFSHVVTMNQI